MLKSISIARYLIIGLRIPKKHAHPASHWICGVFLYISLFILFAFKHSFDNDRVPSNNTEVHSADNHKHKTIAMNTHSVS